MIAFVLVIALIAVSIPLYGHATKTRTGTFQTTIMGKEARNSMIYVGFFMPIAIYALTVGMRVEVQVDRSTYDQVEVGDPVLVDKYSNGTYRLGSRALRI